MTREITSINTQTCKDLRISLHEALAGFAEERGLAIKIGNARFTPGTVEFKVELSVTNEQGETLTREAEDFRMSAAAFGLKPEDLFRTFEGSRGPAKIIGLRPRARKNPILVRHECNGKTYAYGEKVVQALLNH